jgi:hypothetical protein
LTSANAASAASGSGLRRASNPRPYDSQVESCCGQAAEGRGRRAATPSRAKAWSVAGASASAVTQPVSARSGAGGRIPGRDPAQAQLEAVALAREARAQQSSRRERVGGPARMALGAAAVVAELRQHVLDLARRHAVAAAYEPLAEQLRQRRGHARGLFLLRGHGQQRQLGELAPGPGTGGANPERRDRADHQRKPQPERRADGGGPHTGMR